MFYNKYYLFGTLKGTISTMKINVINLLIYLHFINTY